MRRVVIVGSGGSGKSVLAAALGTTLDLPVVHLDRLYWGPGWVTPPDEEWRARQKRLVAEPEWVIDGNHAATLDMRLPTADTVIVLDLHRVRCLARAVKRSLRYRGRPRVDRAEGCRERLDRQFVHWIWSFPSEGRAVLLAAIAEHASQARVVRLRTPREVAAFLRSSRAEPTR